MKKIFLNFLIFFTIFSLFFVPISGAIVFAETNGQNKKIYLALGDSIAEGYAINLKTKTDSEDLITGADDDYSFVENSYTDLIDKYLKENYNYNESYNYSYSGDTCQDLIDFIIGSDSDINTGFYDYNKNECKNATKNNIRFTGLLNFQIYDSFVNAKTITICIGANNILKEAGILITNYLSENLSYEEMESKLKDLIIGDESQNIKGFRKEFQQLLNILLKINNKAEIFFTSVYNPYAVLETSSSLSTFVDQKKLDSISILTEHALDGCMQDSTGNKYYGINEIIKAEIERYNANLNTNFYFVNSKKSFDNIKLADKNDYYNYVNTRLNELELNDLLNYIINLDMQPMELDESVIVEFLIDGNFLDPHPTLKGHELIFNEHKNNKIGTKILKTYSDKQQLITYITLASFCVIIVFLPIVFLKKTKNNVC